MRFSKTKTNPKTENINRLSSPGWFAGALLQSILRSASYFSRNLQNKQIKKNGALIDGDSLCPRLHQSLMWHFKRQFLLNSVADLCTLLGGDAILKSGSRTNDAAILNDGLTLAQLSMPVILLNWPIFSDRRVRKKCPSVLLSQFVGQSVDVAFVTCDRVVSMVGPPDTGRKIYGRLLKVCLDEPIIFCTTATIIQRWWVGGRKKVGELIRWELFLHG